MQVAKRLEFLQTNVFADMDRAKARAIAAGQIDLSLGSSDLPAEAHVIEAIADSLYDQAHGYLLFHGEPSSSSIAGTRKNRHHR